MKTILFAIVCVLVLQQAFALDVLRKNRLTPQEKVKNPDPINAGNFKIEAKLIDNDGIYDFGVKGTTSKLTPPKDEKKPTKAEVEPWTEAIKSYNKGHLRSSSFNIRVSHNDQVIFAYAEGRRDEDFLKTKITSKTDKPLTTSLIADFSDTVSKSTDKITNADFKSIVSTLPKLLSKFFDKATKEIPKAKSKTPDLAMASNKKARFAEVANGGLNYRYYVDIYTGAAFYVGYPGQHSASIIYRVDDSNNAVLRVDYNGNHGRLHNDTGISYSCTHRGAVAIPATDPQPANWDCSTPYWAMWCVMGPNHNCNANAQHHIEISDHPQAPIPGDNVGICATDCPIRAPSC